MNWRVLLVLMAWTPGLHAQDRYLVTYAPEPAAVSVEACFDGAAPTRLYHHEESSRFTRLFRHDSRHLRLADGRDSTRLRNIGANGCIDWVVDLDRAARGNSSRTAMKIGDDWVGDTNLWFFRGPGSRDLVVDISLPPGYAASVPWEPAASGESDYRFYPSNSPARWQSRSAFGRFQPRVVSSGGAEIRLASLGGNASAHRNKLETWISDTAAAVSGIYGRFPRETTQVLAVPIGRRGQPVPWAHVLRGGGHGVELFVDESQPLQAFQSDWTAYHEFSHLLLPFVSSLDRWLSEGLASYYQYVLLARSGNISEQAAWQGLFDGFGRGRRDTRNESLEEATRRGAYPTMRIYWTGAAMMLLADARLRSASHGKQSLDTALASLQGCCLDSNRRWRASEVFRQLDLATGTSVFSDLHDEHVPSHRFPDLSGLWKSLGVDIRRNRVFVVEPAPLSGVRKAIMGG